MGIGSRRSLIQCFLEFIDRFPVIARAGILLTLFNQALSPAGQWMPRFVDGDRTRGPLRGGRGHTARTGCGALFELPHRTLDYGVRSLSLHIVGYVPVVLRRRYIRPIAEKQRRRVLGLRPLLSEQ